jgi:hypothetical protein
MDKEVLEAARWLSDASRTDVDVRYAVAGAMKRLGCSSVSELARLHEQAFFVLVDGLQAMAKEFPEKEMLR